MTNSSSSSPRKARRWFLYGAAAVFLGILSVNFAGTLMALRALALAREQMAAQTGKVLAVRGVSFNVFRGLTLTGATIRSGPQILFDAERIDVGFEGFSYARLPLRVKDARVSTLRLATARLTELVDAVRRLSDQRVPLELYDTFRFSCPDVFFDNAVHLGLSGYLNAVNSEMYTLRGQVSVLKIRCAALSDFDLFEGSNFYQPFDYEFQATRSADRLQVAPIELSNARLKIFGEATVERLTSDEPTVDLRLEMTNILLDDLPVLNRDNVRSRGVLDFLGVLKGPILRPQASLTVSMKNGEIVFFDSLFFSKVNGTTVFSRDQFAGKDLSLELNGVPLAADVKVLAQARPHVTLSLRSLSKVVGAPQLVWQMDADWKGDNLRGAANGSVRYAGHNTVQQIDFDLKDFRLGYDEDLYLYSRTLDVVLTAGGIGADGVTPPPAFQRKAQLEYLFGVLRKMPEGFGLRQVKASCYGGNLEGILNFVPSSERLFVKGEAHVKEVNIRKFVEISAPQSTLTKGQLAGDLQFDNSLTDQIKGQIFVVNGEIERNPILDAVADFFGIASLKRLPFGDLSIHFDGGRGDYDVKVNLKSSLVNADLESKVQSYDTMDGYLSASLSSRLLNESPSFKKLLAYLKHDEPYVVFPFKISSYISSPRILWLKNEFKEKIQNLLPERNQRYLQTQVNMVIEKAGGGEQ